MPHISPFSAIKLRQNKQLLGKKASREVVALPEALATRWGLAHVCLRQPAERAFSRKHTATTFSMLSETLHEHLLPACDSCKDHITSSFAFTAKHSEDKVLVESVSAQIDEGNGLHAVVWSTPRSVQGSKALHLALYGLGGASSDLRR